MPKLMAEEELTARMAATHPHLSPEDARAEIARLQSALNIVPRKATRADLLSLGLIKE